MALDTNTKDMLRNARRFAQEGLIAQMRYCLSVAEEYSNMSGCDISAGREKIEETGYRVTIESNLGRARSHAIGGNKIPMECHLSLAEIYGKETGRDLSSQIETIRMLR